MYFAPLSRSALFVAAATCLVPLRADSPGRADPRKFELNSTNSTYPLVARLRGTLIEQGDSLVIDVEGDFVRSQVPELFGAAGAANDVQISFGLGRQGADDWTFEHRSEAQLVTSRLWPGTSAKVRSLHFIVGGVDTVPLVDRWLVAELRVQQQLPGMRGGALVSYACATENLTGVTPASAARAARMKTRTQYSNAC